MRAASGTCQAFAQQNGLPAPPQQPWTPPLAASATGGPGAGQNVNLNAHAWPPAAFAPTAGPQLRVNALPSYIPNATPITMTPGPTPTAMAAGVAAPDGWFNAADTVPVRPRSVRAVSSLPCPGRARAASRRLAAKLTRSQAYGPIPGCQNYLDPYVASTAPVPARCAAPAAAGAAAPAKRTLDPRASRARAAMH